VKSKLFLHTDIHLVAFYDGDPTPNFQEVGEWKWIAWDEFISEVEQNPQGYSEWSVGETAILKNLNIFH
jgi:isopentenyldiphosphate isomerase